MWNTELLIWDLFFFLQNFECFLVYRSSGHLSGCNDFQHSHRFQLHNVFRGLPRCRGQFSYHYKDYIKQDISLQHGPHGFVWGRILTLYTTSNVIEKTEFDVFLWASSTQNECLRFGSFNSKNEKSHRIQTTFQFPFKMNLSLYGHQGHP